LIILANIFNILITGFEKQDIDDILKFLQEYGQLSHFIKKTVSNKKEIKAGGNNPKIASVRYLIESSIYSTEPEYKVSDEISPVIPPEGVHLVFGLDPLEVINNLKLISERTLVILNANLNSYNEKKDYSVGQIIELLDQYVRRTICMDFEELALIKFKTSHLASFIMIGVAIKEFMGFFIKDLALKILLSKRNEEPNAIKSFETGYNLIS
jgi:Pyruvate/2-oxoacid:ferredoxin oxidoreductase gamma subunit